MRGYNLKTVKAIDIGFSNPKYIECYGQYIWYIICDLWGQFPTVWEIT